MNLRAMALLASLAFANGIAAADGELDADRAFRAASERAVAGDANAVDAFEALGSARPITQWTEHAWAEAARLAERAGDLARARRALDQVISLGTDEGLAQRATVSRARLAAITESGHWDAVAVAHDRLVGEIRSGGDPRMALAQLEVLVRANPGYPRAAAAHRAIARGWEEEGERDRAIAWLRDVRTDDPGQRMHLDLARMLVRANDLDAATRVIEDALDRADADRSALREVSSSIVDGEHRGRRRTALCVILALIVAGAVGALRRGTGSWRAAVRRIRRPPLEVLFLLPVATLLIIVAQTGNPLVARAVRTIIIAGVVVAWISGALLETARARGPVGVTRIVVVATLAVIAVVISAYLAVDRDRVIELLLETWRGGHALR